MIAHDKPHLSPKARADGFRVFRCDGCGEYDVTCWAKEGLAHTAREPGPPRICGYSREVKP